MRPAANKDDIHVRAHWWGSLAASVALGWVPAGQAADALARLQVAPSLSLHALGKDDDMAAFLSADSVIADPDGTITLSGAAQVRRIDAVVKGDAITYAQDTGQLSVRGNGLIMREGSIVKAPSFEYNLVDDSGEVEQPDFWFGATAGAGAADRAEIFNRQHMRLTNAQYTGCPCPDPAWVIRSPQVDLRFDDNEGVARDGVLYFKDVPLLYSPWLSFPLRKERKSGFLLPTYGTSSKSGLDFSLPYYFNLAPNYDATLTPRYLSKRGLQLGGEFRYRGENYAGIVGGTYLSKDRQRGFHRWFFSGEHEQALGGGLRARLALQRASDDDYFRDFSNFGLNEATTDFLTSTAALSWSGSRYVSASLAATRYQTLQDRTGDYRLPQYDKLPELRVRAQRYGWGGLDIVSDNRITRFYMPRFKYGTHAYPFNAFDPWRVPGVGDLAPYQSYDGTRMTSYTTIAYPIVRPGWYITPKVGLHLSHYNTQWNGFGLGPGGRPGNSNLYAAGPHSQTRVLPLLSLDSGMTFERDTRLFGSPARQTLEPRLYYLRVPYRDQSQIPVYDTALATFNFSQAFDENIFSGGWDRIADANQLTVGLSSRWMDADTGFERLSLSAAQRIYFDDQRVTLPGQARRTDSKSDYLVGARAALTDRFHVRFDAQFNPESRERNRMAAGFRWEPKRLTTVSASYRYDRDWREIEDRRYRRIDGEDDHGREQVSLAAQWPLSPRWYALGRYDYSIKEKRSTQSILGLEYKGDCCWAARMVLQRYAVSRQDVNTAFFFQLELSGLGSLGTNPMSLLSERIAGYQNVTPPPSEPTRFERYE